MATSITTFSGLRCTRIARTQFFTATSTSAATETAALPVILPSSSTSTIQDTSSTSLISSTIAQQTGLSPSNPTSSLTSLATTVVAASSTVTAAAATFLPAVTSLAGPSSTQSSDSNSGDSTENTSKTKVIAAAIGASLAAVAVVALVILCAYFRRRKRRTPSQINDREKGPGTIGRFSGVTRVLDRVRPGPTTAFIPAVVGKGRPVLADLRNFRLTTRKSHSNTPEQTQSELTERRLSVGRPIPHENPIERQDMSSAPRTMPESTDPFADSPTVNIATNRNNTRPENPFADSADPFSHTDYESEASFAMPLTIRNGHVDDDDIVDTDINTNSNNNISHQSNRSTLSGSTLNISNGRPSSPLVYQFNLRPQAWKPYRHFQDRSSTHSDPFDLERPPTIHSSAHPTPMVEEQKSQRGGYFPEMNHNDPRYSS